MRVLQGLIGGGEVREGDEAETSRAPGAVVYGDCGVQNGTVLGEVEFENIFGGFTRNAPYEQLRSIGIHLQIHSSLLYTIPKSPIQSQKPLSLFPFLAPNNRTLN